MRDLRLGKPGGTAALSSDLEKRLGVLRHLRMSRARVTRPVPRLPAARWKLLEALSSVSRVEYWATPGEGVPAGCPVVFAAQSNSVLQVGWPALWAWAVPGPSWGPVDTY